MARKKKKIKLSAKDVFLADEKDVFLTSRLPKRKLNQLRKLSFPERNKIIQKALKKAQRKK